MNNLYKFSPIHNEPELLDAITYIAQEATKLAYEITGDTYKISSLTVFSHYPNEFEELKQLLLKLGEIKTENNGPYITLHKPLHLPHNELHFLRVRKPDPYRMQVGCCDFDIRDYKKFKDELVDKRDGLRAIERPEYEMIEFYNPDYDVLAYVVSKSLIR